MALKSQKYVVQSYRQKSKGPTGRTGGAFCMSQGGGNVGHFLWRLYRANEKYAE